MKKLLIIITLITVGCHPLHAFELRMNNQDALKQQMIGLLLNQLFNGNQVNVGNTNINKNVIANWATNKHERMCWISQKYNSNGTIVNKLQCD
tara:strand:- start:413 stop:691 length:279 start_codon:yes stop_codon:yes gene_type:complete